MSSIIKYAIVLLILKIYTAWPVFSLRKQAPSVISNEVQKRNLSVVNFILGITLLFLIFVGMYIVGGIFNIIAGDSFYDAFNHKAPISEAYDEETEGEFSKTSYNLFKFGLRMIIINLVVIKPIFGTGILEHYHSSKK